MIRELDSRHTQDGERIVLTWNDETDSVELHVEPTTGAAQSTVVRGERAADAFRHPYAYLPRP